MRPLALLASVFALALISGCEDGPYDQPPPGDFACGTTFCDTLTQICIEEAAGSTCENAPPACNGAPACSCAVSCTGGTCAAASDGSITVTCE